MGWNSPPWNEIFHQGVEFFTFGVENSTLGFWVENTNNKKYNLRLKFFIVGVDNSTLGWKPAGVKFLKWNEYLRVE